MKGNSRYKARAVILILLVIALLSGCRLFISDEDLLYWPPCSLSLDRLIRFLEDDNVLHRRQAARVLEGFNATRLDSDEHKKLINALLAATEDADSTVRCWAIAGLSSQVQQPDTVLPILIDLLGHKDEATISTAGGAIGALAIDGHDVSEAIPVMIGTLDVDDLWFRRSAVIYGLSEIGPPAIDAYPILLRLLDDAEVRLILDRLLVVLAKISIDDTLPLIRDILSREDYKIRMLALKSLEKIGKEHDVSELLIMVLHDDDQSIRGSAATTAKKIGPMAAGAIPALIVCLDAESEWVQKQAAYALGLITTDPISVDALIEAIEKDNPCEVKSACIAALGDIGKDASKAIPVLKELEAICSPPGEEICPGILRSIRFALGKINGDS